MDSKTGLEKMSRRVRYLGVFVGFVSIIIAALRWFVIDDPNWLPPTIVAHIEPDNLTRSHRQVGFLIELLPLAAALYTLSSLHQICTAYTRGELFAKGLGVRYKKFGTGLLLLGLANGLYTSLIIATFSLLSRERQLSVALGFSTADLYLFIVGLVVLMIGTVMEEAHHISTENQQFI